MNDRVSNKPPSIYMKAGDAMEGLSNPSHKKAVLRKAVGMEGNTTSYDAGIEVSKPSGVYRFGRALVNAFKPITVWRGFSNNREEKDQNLPSEKSLMQERQLKAEKAYAELKKNGYKGTQPSSRTVECLSIPVIKVEPAIDERRHYPLRDSGVDVDGYCPSTESEHNDQVLTPARTPIPLPPTPPTRRMVSPTSNASSPRKSSLHFRKPSFQNLKKVKSQIQLPSMKRPMSIEPESGGEHSTVQRDLRKQPSRKDIAKQVKLSKKVSNLEAQLEIARLNLRRSMHETPADANIQLHRGPRAFKPGALASLPSERLLSKGLVINERGEALRTEEAEAVYESFSEKQAMLSSGDDQEEIAGVDAASQLEKELVDSFKQHNLCKKRNRESRPDVDIPSTTEPVDANIVESSGVKEERPKRRLRSSSKIQEIIVTSADDCKILEQGSVLRTPSIRPHQALEEVPPLPTAQVVFDPSQVDQARLLSMRCIGDMKTPFGRHPEDLDNLRKEFPMISTDQLARYVDKLSRDDTKVTDHTSLAHHHQEVVAPLLARPRSVSPIKSEPRKAPKPIRPALQICNYNSNSTILKPNGTTTDAMEQCRVLSGTVDLVKSPVGQGQLLPPFPNLIAPVVSGGDRKVENEKPTPIIQKEEYEWPDDVF